LSILIKALNVHPVLFYKVKHCKSFNPHPAYRDDCRFFFFFLITFVFHRIFAFSSNLINLFFCEIFVTEKLMISNQILWRKNSILKGSDRQYIVVKLSTYIVEKFLGIIWDQWYVFMKHICSARAQIQPLKFS